MLKDCISISIKNTRIRSLWYFFYCKRQNYHSGETEGRLHFLNQRKVSNICFFGMGYICPGSSLPAKRLNIKAFPASCSSPPDILCLLERRSRCLHKLCYCVFTALIRSFYLCYFKTDLLISFKITRIFPKLWVLGFGYICQYPFFFFF